ncbi:MAG: hypothetical protein HY725_14110 [Candidatus Rokubacteria bacterium]|nr:hypothetical protein [Candidatus Rokubacteria bacterium]
MSTPWLVLAAIVTLALLYVLFPVVAETFLRLRRGKLLRCPETGSEAEVRIDAPRAAFTAAFSQPRLRVKDCSRWPQRKSCEEGCLDVPEREMREAHAGRERW